MVLNDYCPPLADQQAVSQSERTETESITHTVVRALASAKNVPVTEIEPLHKHVDTEALNSLYDDVTHSTSNVKTRFTFQNYCVVIPHGGHVYIYKRRDRA
ncbi:uncharacterized protein Nmag_0983 [Natrialba magadii ATCC 43099]|uniref:Halobacterial output domain-containing protein n=1 Tax=Natrialba magadii (strain ATCC 43099 / DSM 3394 / CCM 3739 / CIP 104546 / IAM 13178 / JCM 8861 / NBRC 102185 / NCIMB 2190 / MS3) TaxID=547559 RepID=D3SQS9_NATMM|nr:uncharacterized protein Nmag_0983 [Natrialba magadii ATCC 43099]